MKEHSELFSICKSFCIEIQNQFGKTIKILCSVTHENISQLPFSPFMSSHGILRHTPQQNGVAKGKN